MGMLVELYVMAGMPEEGLALLGELFEIVEAKNDHSYEPELFRLKGELLLNRAGADRPILDEVAGEIENCFHQALEIARKQGARSFELRAAISLGRLLKERDRTEEGRRILSDVYRCLGFGWLGTHADVKVFLTRDARAE